MSADNRFLAWLLRLSLGKAILLAFLTGWALHLPTAFLSYHQKGLLNDFDAELAVPRFIGHVAGIGIFGFLVAVGILIFSRKSERRGILPAITALIVSAIFSFYVFSITAP